METFVDRINTTIDIANRRDNDAGRQCCYCGEALSLSAYGQGRQLCADCQRDPKARAYLALKPGDVGFVS